MKTVLIDRGRCYRGVVRSKKDVNSLQLLVLDRFILENLISNEYENEVWEHVDVVYDHCCTVGVA